jgi:TRAP-type C4-dicarboxylate transport system substrate-binding protein
MRRLTVLCSIFVLVCAVFSLMIAPAYGQAKPIELTYSIFFPAPAPQTQVAMEWAKEIERKTNGRIKITIFPGGTLTAADKCYDGVIKGISDLGMSCFAYTRGRFPLTEVADLPLGMKSGLVATKILNAYYKKFQPKEMNDVKVMYLHGHGPGFLHTKTAVEKLEDLKGMKIRCTGLAKKIVEKLGAVPVAMPMPDTYDALSRGVVDGSMAPQESLKTWKWGEVVKFTTESWGAAYSTGFFVVMNKKKWNSLPNDIRKTIERVNKEWIEKQGKNWDDIDKGGRDATIAAGNKIISLSKEENMRWAAAVRPILDEYVANMKVQGLPGAKALKFYMDELKKLQ